MLNNLLLGQTGEEKLYVEDVFSTYLYTGNNSSQTITNGIDLSGKGGLIWTKSRSSGSYPHQLFDSARGFTNINGNVLSTNSTGSGTGYEGAMAGVNSDGFSLASGNANASGVTYASWTFRKAPKFFDVVTYTGNGSATTISHSLGTTPGMIIVKKTSAAASWAVYHRSNATNQYLFLNATDATATSVNYWNNTAPTSTSFSLGASTNVNESGQTYVAYLFAHDTTADGIVQCGSFTKDGSGNATVSLGWEPQYVLVKSTNGSNAAVGDSWLIADIMRGANYTATAWLEANASTAEGAYGGPWCVPTATGFQINGLSGGSNHIYLAIRRGPMRTPTDATKVFSPQVWTGNSTTGRNIATGFPVDLTVEQIRTASVMQANLFFDRLRGYSSVSSGGSLYLRSQETSAEVSLANYNYVATMDGFNFGSVASGANQFNNSGVTAVGWNFRRAPGFFDVVCYTGNASANRAVTHNLGVPYELIIIKSRTTNIYWVASSPYMGTGSNGNFSLYLNTNDSKQNDAEIPSTTPTTTQFFLGPYPGANGSGASYVAYLFASCPGVSKVGTYTGNGSSQNINCGFTNGARFILIKRTDSTGDWYVWDTARGIIAANDPHLSLNSTAAEVTTNDTIDPLSTGFTVNQVSATNVNVNAATYIYLAIA